jgi:hypothetical protein
MSNFDAVCWNLSLLAMHIENQELELQARSWSSGALELYLSTQHSNAGLMVV